MLKKIALCVTSAQLTAGVWRFGKLLSYEVFPNNEQGHEGFRHFLHMHPRTRIYCAVDAVEEDYHQENLPHTYGNARTELLSRKLGQMYRNVTFKSATFIGRETEKRRDDRFIYLSLTKSEFLEPWLQAIEAANIPLVGVYMLSMMGEQLVARMKLHGTHLLLSERLNSGLRQSYFYQGRLMISRLAPISASMRQRMGYFYVTETEKTRLYLISQRFITRETPLKMVLPALDESGVQICRNISQEQGIECESENLASFVKRLGLNPQLLVQHPELLHLHLLVKSRPPVSLAPSTYTKHYKLYNLRQAINGATVASALIGFGLAAVDAMEASSFIEQTQQAAIETRLQDQQYRDVAKDFPTTTVPSSDLKTAVEVNRTINTYAATPERLMRVVSEGVTQWPEIQINRIFWVKTNDVSIKDQAEGQASSASAPSQNVAVPADPALADTTVLHEVGFVNCEIARFNGDYRAALNVVNRFAEKLKTLPDVAAVEIVQAPVNVSSYSDLQGTTSDEVSKQSSAALFKIKLILKREVQPT